MFNVRILKGGCRRREAAKFGVVGLKNICVCFDKWNLFLLVESKLITIVIL